MFSLKRNFLLKTDSYKVTHWPDYPFGTKTIESYFESRKGASFPYTVFYGLQSILKRYMVGQVVYPGNIGDAELLAKEHFMDDTLFNAAGWKDILNRYEGRLPLEIKAVPEGTPVPIDNVLMTVKNTDPKYPWLTNWCESLLTHVWYPSTVATLSRSVKEDLKGWLDKTSDHPGGLPFMLHDFGYRGATCDDAAAVGGSAHLINFMGTDTLPAMEHAHDYYGASYQGLAYSVPATEHSIMTSEGEEGEANVVKRLLDNHPNGILSLVGDSYNIYSFVDKIIASHKDKIMTRKGKVVIRPDSVTPLHKTPAEQVVWILNSLARIFGSLVNNKGYVVVNPCVGVLWGDGIDRRGINDICAAVEEAGFSVESLVFGMGGGLLQKVNRDTQRFAFKCSARQDEEGVWHDIYKKPLDDSKASKRGRLKLVKKDDNKYVTVAHNDYCLWPDQLKTVFINGHLLKQYNFADVRKNAELK